jgi:hypothetical protein
MFLQSEQAYILKALRHVHKSFHGNAIYCHARQREEASLFNPDRNDAIMSSKI